MADSIDIKAKELVAHLCRHRDSYKPDLSREEKEDLAGSILAVWVMSDEEVDGSKSVRDKYKVFDKIEELASNLDWSNSIDINKDWQELIGYINEIEEQIKNSKSNNQSQSSQD